MLLIEADFALTASLSKMVYDLPKSSGTSRNRHSVISRLFDSLKAISLCKFMSQGYSIRLRKILASLELMMVHVRCTCEETRLGISPCKSR